MLFEAHLRYYELDYIILILELEEYNIFFICVYSWIRDLDIVESKMYVIILILILIIDIFSFKSSVGLQNDI